MNVETIEVSKELLRCADWMVCRNGMADYEPTMDDFLRWSGMIRSLVIPEPLSEPEIKRGQPYLSWRTIPPKYMVGGEPLNKTAEDEIGNSDLDDGC